VDKALALRVWNLLNDGHSLYVIEQRVAVPTRTGQRLKTALEGFESQTDIHEIAEDVGLSEKTVGKYQGWWKEFADDLNQVEVNRGDDDLTKEGRRRHYLDLERALNYMKVNLEPIAGGIPDDLLAPWDPQGMDLIFVDNLLSHFEGTELPESFGQATIEGPREPRREAALVAIAILRDLLASRRFSGHCRYCL
jgi:hypothetical protein